MKIERYRLTRDFHRSQVFFAGNGIHVESLIVRQLIFLVDRDSECRYARVYRYFLIREWHGTLDISLAGSVGRLNARPYDMAKTLNRFSPYYGNVAATERATRLCL